MAGTKGNKNAVGNEGGRPPIYDDPKKLEEAVNSYFKDNNKVTITGLAYHLGFCSRDTLYQYEKKVEFSDIIKRAKLRVEMKYEERLSEGNCTGAIFALKNMDWKDKSEQEQYGKDGGPIQTENKFEWIVKDFTNGDNG